MNTDNLPALGAPDVALFYPDDMKQAKKIETVATEFYHTEQGQFELSV